MLKVDNTNNNNYNDDDDEEEDSHTQKNPTSIPRNTTSLLAHTCST